MVSRPQALSLGQLDTDSGGLLVQLLRKGMDGELLGGGGAQEKNVPVIRIFRELILSYLRVTYPICYSRRLSPDHSHVPYHPSHPLFSLKTWRSWMISSPPPMPYHINIHQIRAL